MTDDEIRAYLDKAHADEQAAGERIRAELRRERGESTTAPELTVGALVAFRTPTADEVDDRFRVLELRGDRVLVEDASPYWNDATIRPQSVYLVADLIVVA